MPSTLLVVDILLAINICDYIIIFIIDISDKAILLKF